MTDIGDFFNKKAVVISVWLNGPEYSATFTVPPNDKDRRTFKLTAWNWDSGILETKPDGTTTKSKSPWHQDTTYVDNHFIKGMFNSSGPVEFFVYTNGKEVRHEWQDVDSRTGGFGSGTMNSLQATQIGVEEVVQYTFHESRSFAPHHLYVTVAPPRTHWMRDVAPPGSANANKPFGMLVLPTAHNCGMYSIQTTRRLFNTEDKGAIAAILAFFPGWFKLLALPAAGTIVETVRLTSVNQKDDITSQLKMGARYFELRASRINPKMRIASDLPDTLYFHHNIFPGMALDSFYDEVVAFLAEHPDEIVVVYTEISGWSGDNDQSNAKAQLEQWRAAAIKARRDKLVVGTIQDLKTMTIAQLRDAGKRLICAYKDEASLNDIFDGERHGNSGGTGILEEFELMAETYDKTCDWTMMQCQSTLMENTEMRALAILARDNILLQPKAHVDPKTLGWLQANVTSRFKKDQLMVIMNDFFDMATADTAIQLSRNRMAAS
jgi:hypothetical protein